MTRNPLKPFSWFSPVVRLRCEESVFSALAKAGAGLLIGGFLACRGFVTAGIVVCAIVGCGQSNKQAELGSEREKLTLQESKEQPGNIIALGKELENVPPVINVWPWQPKEFEPEGYKPFLDMVARNSHYDVLFAVFRTPGHEITDPDMHDQIRRAADYARAQGMRLIVDLCIREAREAFRQKHPDKMLELLRLKRVSLADSGEVSVSQEAAGPFIDHYTYDKTPYITLAGRLVRIYSYVRDDQGIDGDSVTDITASCRVTEASAKQVSVTIPCSPATRGREACVMVAFAHLFPDIFSPEIVAFQRAIVRQYADCGLLGACKDEWGVPPWQPKFCRLTDDFWFSRDGAEAYARHSEGRDLLRDVLLMSQPHCGQESDRLATINRYMEFFRCRNAALEDDFYRVVKKTFGPEAFVGTHPTWHNRPHLDEMRRNGVHWWAATRDFGQTDFNCSYSIRTALSKRWGGSLWYNMNYSSNIKQYEVGIWRDALAGGRYHFHPQYPTPGGSKYSTSAEALLRGRLLQGDARIRLLNFVVRSPLDCPVAMVFGHPSAQNFAGAGFEDYGIAAADALWTAGYYADLIPSDDIHSGALRLDKAGYLRYGPQRYEAALFYHPQFERPAAAKFFRRVAQAGKTALVRMGPWTRGFDGQPFDGDAALPGEMVATGSTQDAVARVLDVLRNRGLKPQTPFVGNPCHGGRPAVLPPLKGQTRLIDGTVVLTAAEQDVVGDPMQVTVEIQGRPVLIHATGIAAIRLDADGRLDALAAGGLSRFETGDLRLVLPQPVDLALWRNSDGRFRGILQDWSGDVPPPLASLTDRWSRLAVPVPLK